MTNSLSNWQDALNEGLVTRLTRPLRQPGMMNRAMGERIINRCDRFLNRLPLLSQQMQRWGNTNTLSSESIPIVYAQPVSLTKEKNLENRGHDSQPIVSQNQPSPTIIQRKLDFSQSLPSRTVTNPIAVQNSTDLSNSQRMSENSQNIQTDLSPNLSPTSPVKPTFDLKLDKTSISASEIPVVSPITNSQELLTTEEMALAGLTQSSKSSPTISELSINKSSDFSQEMENLSPNLSPTRGSHCVGRVSRLEASGVEALKPTFDLKLDETSISASEIPVVSPIPTSEKLLTTEEMRLAVLTESSKSSPTISELNRNQLSQELSEIPVVSPQPISDAPLPIIQAKVQNDSGSHSSLPIVNNLNPLIDKQQIETNNYTNLSSVKSEVLISQISSKELPIVTAQNLKSENYFNNPEIQFAINSHNYQNQSAIILDTQPINTPNSQINQTNNKQNISPLPVVTVNSSSNPSLKPQSSPLPLAKTTSSSRINNQQLNLSNRNSISNTDSSSSTRTFASSLSPTETSVSPASSRNIDIDVNAIASQVERKLMRKLVIESERRGKNR